MLELLLEWWMDTPVRTVSRRVETMFFFYSSVKMFPLLFTAYVFGGHLLNEDWDNAITTFMYGVFLAHVPRWMQYALVTPVLLLYGLGWLGEVFMVNALTF